MPLRILMVVGMLVFAVFGDAQSNTYGKTNAQILAMGRDKWFDFYTSKAGESTLGMADAERIFGDVLAKRNDKLILKESKTRQAGLKVIRDAAQDLGIAMVHIGMAYTGGGTIWTPIVAGVHADVEESVFNLLSKTKLSATERKAPSFDALKKTLTKMKSDLAASKKKIAEYSSPENDLYERAVQAQAAAVAAFDKITKAMAGLRSTERTRVAALIERLIGLKDFD